jgi:ABC-type multidrug transport system ATPase subunit
VAADFAVEIRRLHKQFRIQRTWRELIRRPGERDIRVALDGVDLEVRRGEFFGVLGQNGAGKTTLFKILATLVRPDAGHASVAGIDVVERPAQARRALIPVVASERSLYWRVSAEENLRLYATLYGLRGAEARKRIGEALAVVGLDQVGAKQVGLFSSGMKQRLLIARALLGRPEILLLDEPTRSLDPVSARDLRVFLRDEIGKMRGITVLVATHDQEEVTELCARVAVLDQGRVLAVGDTEALLGSARLKLCSLWTSEPSHPALHPLVEAAGGRIVAREGVSLSEGDGWSRVRVEVATDEAGMARLLASVAAAGIPVSRFTREGVSLADLLERVRAEAGATSNGRPT